MTGEQSVPEQIRETIEASDYPELTVREVTQHTGLTEQQVYSAAGSMARLELDRRVGVVRLPEDDGGEFVSFEPLIGPVGEVDLSGYDWAIVGGESGDGYRDMEHEWARSIRDQCRRDDVRFFFKQSAGRHPETGTDLTVEHETHGVYVRRRSVNCPSRTRWFETRASTWRPKHD
ncbi:hypothetical protein DJ69_08140 [Halorubrum persicum]|uniref:Uncharacterized protein n=1 Tax=Halorubrum persicum TaxID=1383844 RepID=A0A2G1WJA1_9EURY|nr:DUF5131 family protein [Halorubrum persicum]PHQ39078.1 hypothetical protein DJ69_08140 [Halorubrum persicum]